MLSELNKLFDFIEEIKARYPDFSIIGITAHKEKNISDIGLKSPLMLRLGNESDGLCKGFKSICDILATIPMSNDPSASSLNVACAATVLMYEVECRTAKMERMKNICNIK